MPHFIFIQQISVLNILNMLYNLHFFSSKCRLFHNATLFGFSITHILNTGCAKIWKKKSVAKRLRKLTAPWTTSDNRHRSFKNLQCNGRTWLRTRSTMSYIYCHQFLPDERPALPETKSVRNKSTFSPSLWEITHIMSAACDITNTSVWSTFVLP